MNSTRAHAALHAELYKGTLDAPVVSLLDRLVPSWRVTPAERRWWENHHAYTDWMTQHGGRHPAVNDDGAAGLHVWFVNRTDSDLNVEQRAALRAIPGWNRTDTDPAWADVRNAVAALESDTDAESRTLLTYLRFTLTTGRTPEAREPGGLWARRARPASHPVRQVLGLIPDSARVSASFAGRCAEFHALDRTDAEKNRPAPTAEVCTSCFMEKPVSGICDTCD